MPLKVKNMKLTEDEADESKPTAVADSTPKYPYGLSLHLDEIVIEKLGLEKLPVSGTTITGAFKATVESSSIREDKEGKHRSISLQITKLGISGGAEDIEEESESVGKTSEVKDQKDVADTLFGD